MEAEQILELMDSCWFERRIFRNKNESPSLAAEFMHQEMDKSGEKSTVQNLQIRSYSDRCIAVDFEADSPRSVITKPKLQKTPSEKERREKHRMKRRERARKGVGRSLSALEFEELKGFMDLGFVFNEEETNPGLVSIVPALQKWRKTAAGAATTAAAVEKKGGVSRPYLSEAWGDLSRRRGDEDVLMNLKIPFVKNEMDMKCHLKNWAHVVASTVR